MPDLFQALRVLLGPDKQGIALTELCSGGACCGPAAHREEAELERQ